MLGVLGDVGGVRIPATRGAGFWVPARTKLKSYGIAGGCSEITWWARRGIWPVSCAQGVLFDQCWGGPLSTIQTGSWNADRHRYRMEGRLYVHYKPVPSGMRGSIEVGGQSFVVDGLMGAGVFVPCG